METCLIYWFNIEYAFKEKNYTSPLFPNPFYSYVDPFECQEFFQIIMILNICPPSWSMNPLWGMFRSHYHYTMHILHTQHFSVTFLLKSLNLWSSSSGVLLGGMSAEQLLNVIIWLVFYFASDLFFLAFWPVRGMASWGSLSLSVP